MLGQIEESGEQALTAMRRLVVLLRTSAAPTAPVAGLAQVRELVEDFSRTGTGATLSVDPDLAARLPPDLAAVVHRVVREALTNIRKHAQDATNVVVSVTQQPDTVTVTDDGSGTTAPGVRGGGGFGLVGMRERVQAMAGTLSSARYPTAAGAPPRRYRCPTRTAGPPERPDAGPS